MKCVILAGGLGTRLSEETSVKPKPMVKIGTQPIIWHIMKIYSHYGIKDFIVCCGYKSEIIKSYFLNYSKMNSNLIINLKDNKVEFLNKKSEDWKITLVETGKDTMTGGRLRRVKNLLNNDENFLMTYGDGLSNINLNKLIKFHKTNKSIATITGIEQNSRFGVIKVGKNNKVKSFLEKPLYHNSLINGGFFMFNKKIFQYLKNDKTILEKTPLEKIVKERKLYVYKHNGFWYSMDTLRDKVYLEKLWYSSNPPWKIWE
ncbi:glucose-1-phosphate cytidylyltransferase [Pelagibacteraceae bacterium]|nr:glucose-1-phosphate cytidylyltransferase [Pelagibacteraceae bacterium]